jgi:CDP-glycerol glycerophosphotransferase (TagB/SpsB family)
MQVAFVFLDDDPAKFYQLRQWLQPLKRLSLSHSVAVIHASEQLEAELRQAGLTGHRVKLHAGLTQLLNQLQPRLMLYPNQNVLNFYATAYSRAIHAWVSHGESDKAYMVQNTLKRYDLYFAAGAVAAARVAKAVAGFNLDRIRLIGRPQLQDEHPVPSDFLASSNALKVLYAPTWEGVTKPTRYGSIESHGIAIVTKLIEMGAQVVYRPHPLSGTIESDVAQADRKIRELIKTSNQNLQTAHFVDTSEFGWQLNALDVMITDISAVAYDWLATGKPMLITKPTEPEAVLLSSPLLEAIELFDVEQVESLDSLIDLATLQATSLQTSVGSLRQQYFGDDTDADEPFRRAVEEALEMQESLPVSSGAASRELRPFAAGAKHPALLRYPSFALRMVMQALKLWVRVGTTPPTAPDYHLKNLYAHFSDPFDSKSAAPVARELYALAKAGDRLHLVTNQVSTYLSLSTHFWWHNLIGGFKNHSIIIHPTVSTADAEAVLQALKPERVLYTKDHPHNLMMLRINGAQHFLYRPESDPNFEPSHALTTYDVVVTNSEDARQTVRGILAAARPQLQKLGSKPA